MTRYFVHIDTDYYPWAEIVEAESPEEAIEKALKGGANLVQDGVWVTRLENMTHLGRDLPGDS